MKNYISSFNRALNWVRNNTIEDSGIAVTNLKQQIYPEVTGYYIPSLIQWGERRLARAYAEYLCSIQKKTVHGMIPMTVHLMYLIPLRY